MVTLVVVVGWVLPSVLISMAVGFYVGRGSNQGQQRTELEAAQKERASALKALVTLLKSAEQMTSNVDSHNSEIKEVERTVGDLKLTGELKVVQGELLTQITAVLDANQRLEDDLVCTRYRMEEQAQELDRTRLEARTDSLSGVGNRKAFDETLQFLLADFKRNGAPFVLVLADIDHFKWINDTHGHAAGDRVVNYVGTFLKECLRAGDHLARYGGDEFALLFSGIGVDQASEISNLIRLAVEGRNFNVGITSERIAVTFSMGLSKVEEGDTPDSVFERADRALYQSKEAGRNQLHCWQEDGELVKIGE